MTEKSKLGSILVQSKLIAPDDVERALNEQKRSGVRFGQALIDLGIIQNEDVGWGLSSQLNIPFIRLTSDPVDTEAVKLVPEPLARRHSLLPFLKIEKELTVVLEDPLNQRAIAEVEAVTGCTVNICIGLLEEITAKIDEVYGTSSPDKQDVAELETDIFSSQEREDIGSDYTGETFLRTLLDKAIARFSSAIHFEPKEGRVHIRFRTEGGIETVGSISEGWFLVLSNRLKTIMDNVETREAFLEGFISHNFDSKRFVFYTSIVTASHGTTVTLLNLTPKNFPDDFDDLPIDEQDRENILRIIGGRAGLAMIVGRGKIEKLKFIDLLLRKKHADAKKTFIIGSMPWFADAGYIQLKVKVEDRQDLLEGLKVAMTQDPDLLYIEDVWDKRVLQFIMQSAVPNTFAMTSLHFPDTLTALEYANENIENKTLLALALRGLIGIYVFNLLCPDCKTVDDDYQTQARTLRLTRAEVEKHTIYKSGGCDKCHHRGYDDTKILIETLQFDDEVSELVKTGAKFEVVKEMIRNRGHKTIAGKARDMVLSGQIGIDDYKNVERR